MSGLLYLTSEDFNVQEGTRGKLLCNTISGFSLILFYSTQCRFCQNLIPIFKQLPGSIGNCQFGMVNVGNNVDLIRMSGQTVTPLEYVPYIVLYLDTKPFVSYSGPSDLGEIQRFVIEIANSIRNKPTFAHPKVQEQKGKVIPAYTIGVPLCGTDDVCYLKNDEAYVPGPNQGRPGAR